MPAGLGTDATLGTTSVVGRYFGVISTVPSVLLAGWVYLLLASGAWTGAPTLKMLNDHNPLKHPGALAAAVALALTLAFVGHASQFSLVQLLEGYWGRTQFGRNLHNRLVTRHLRRLAQAQDLSDRGQDLQAELPGLVSGNLSEHVSAWSLAHSPGDAAKAVRSQSMIEEGAAVARRYPREGIDTMPTMLGNTLRRHELLAGNSVGLPVLTWATHIGMVADPAQSSYLNDQRTQLDLAVRMTAKTGLAAVFTFALLWDEKWWALLALGPYAVAWLSYKGALSSADAYGMALRAWVDLNRFRLYDALALKPVASVGEEQERNLTLETLASGASTFALDPERKR